MAHSGRHSDEVEGLARFAANRLEERRDLVLREGRHLVPRHARRARQAYWVAWDRAPPFGLTERASKDRMQVVDGHSPNAG